MWVFVCLPAKQVAFFSSGQVKYKHAGEFLGKVSGVTGSEGHQLAHSVQWIQRAESQKEKVLSVSVSLMPNDKTTA